MEMRSNQTIKEKWYKSWRWLKLRRTNKQKRKPARFCVIIRKVIS